MKTAERRMDGLRREGRALPDLSVRAEKEDGVKSNHSGHRRVTMWRNNTTTAGRRLERKSGNADKRFLRKASATDSRGAEWEMVDVAGFKA